jgi:hypothetical protein
MGKAWGDCYTIPPLHGPKNVVSKSFKTGIMFSPNSYAVDNKKTKTLKL